MAEAGLTPVAEFHGSDWEPDLGERATEPIIASGATAVICANDRIAFGVYQACLKRGTRIPQDLSVMSFDNEQLASYLTPGLTTVEIPYQAMGEAATKLVLDAMGKRAGQGADDDVAEVSEAEAADAEDAGMGDTAGYALGADPAPTRIHMPLIERESVRHI